MKRTGDLRKKYREIETELNMNAPRIEKSQEKLRAVKTNKEYQSLLKEIEELKKKNSSLEDEMIECLEHIESSEASDKQSETEYRSIEDAFSRKSRNSAKRPKRAELELETLKGNGRLWLLSLP